MTITFLSNTGIFLSIILIIIASVLFVNSQEMVITHYMATALNENQIQTHSNFELSLKGQLLVGNAKSNSVSIIDLYNNKIIKNIIVGKGPHDIKISDDQQLVYTSDIDSGTVSILNLSNNSLNQINLSSTTTTTNIAVHGIALHNDTIYTGGCLWRKSTIYR